MTPTQIESFVQRLRDTAMEYIDVNTADHVALLLAEAAALIESLAPAPVSSVPFDTVVNCYHTELPMLGKVMKLTDTRKRQLAARWNEDADRQNALWWATYFRQAAKSDFLTGRQPSRDGRVWKADFEFFLQPKSMTRVLEGFYRDDTARKGGDLVHSVMFERGAR